MTSDIIESFEKGTFFDAIKKIKVKGLKVEPPTKLFGILERVVHGPSIVCIPCLSN